MFEVAAVGCLVCAVLASIGDTVKHYVVGLTCMALLVVAMLFNWVLEVQHIVYRF